MQFTKLMMAAAACSLAATPAVASPAAAKLSISKATAARSTTPTGESNQQAGGFPFLIVFGVIAVGLGIYAITDGDDTPDSP